MARLRDLVSREFETAAGDISTGASDRSLVLVDQRGDPISVLAPGAVLDPATPRPPIMVAPADLDLNTPLAAAAFAQAGDISAVVAVDEHGIVGVWSGPSLEKALEQGLPVTRGGHVLPGPPQIPLVVRSCRYLEHGTRCKTVSAFVNKPFPMPGCRNDHNLSAHQFGW
jgi:hypothetical protein